MTRLRCLPSFPLLVLLGAILLGALRLPPLDASAAVPARNEAALAAKLAEALATLPSEQARGVKLLEALSKNSRPLEDVVTYLLASAVAASDPERGKALCKQLLASWPRSPVAGRATATLAEILAAEHDLPGLVALSQSRSSSGELADPEAARVALATGRVLAERSPQRALPYLIEAESRAPLEKAGEQAARLLEQLRREHPELEPQSAEQLYREAVIAARQKRYEDQTRLLDRLLSRFSDHRLHDAALLARAGLMARQSGRPVAARWLASQAAEAKTPPSQAGLLFESSVYWWNANEEPKALAGFEKVVAMQTGIEQEQRAFYAIGRIHEAARRYNAAARAYRKASHGKDERLAAQSHWRAGWASYLAGNYDGAAWVFGAMADASRQRQGASNTRAEALYWQARSLERAHRQAEAKGLYRTLVAELPNGYYAYLVEKRIGLAAPVPARPKRSSGYGELPEELRRRLTRAQILKQAGLDDLGDEEITGVLWAADRSVQRALLPFLLRLGAFGPALRAATSLHGYGLIDGEELAIYLYPRAFSEIVVHEATQHGLDPLLVYSLMRQESLFDRRAVSTASAYGLMQLLPATAKRVAPGIGVDRIEPRQLFEPALNIRLGIEYLAALARRFDDDPVLMLAGYNAGELAAEHWQAARGKLDEDEFVEQISYTQTRDYIKKVLGNYRHYRRLYGGSETVSLGLRGP